MEVLLEVKDLRTYYHTHSRTVPAADDVNFTIHRGEVVGLVGESGCGKSTVARSIVGLIDKTYTSIESGQILFDGKDLTKATKAELCDIRGNKISMIFQDPFVSLSPVYTVGDQIYEVMKAHDPKLKKRDAIPAILQLMQKAVATCIHGPAGTLCFLPCADDIIAIDNQQRFHYLREASTRYIMTPAATEAFRLSMAPFMGRDTR